MTPVKYLGSGWRRIGRSVKRLKKISVEKGRQINRNLLILATKSHRKSVHRVNARFAKCVA
ncbi:MAG TPA: hypothetical protein DIW27_08840 [Cytophagales bacterium]|nr:hypothetical protein [Cytophagales bacterium]